jgi:IS30 family transposase
VGRPLMPRAFERAFWRLIGLGWQTHRAALEVGVSANTGIGGSARLAACVRWRWPSRAAAICRWPSGRRSICAGPRADLCWAEGWSQAEIARELGRDPATVSRELKRNRLLQYPRRPGPSGRPLPRGRLWYRAAPAQAKAEERARRPKPGKLAVHPELRELVQAGLIRRWSPQQISRVLRREHPDRPELQVSHETIYRSLFVQGRGELRRYLARCLRTGRAAPPAAAHRTAPDPDQGHSADLRAPAEAACPGTGRAT